MSTVTDAFHIASKVASPHLPPNALYTITRNPSSDTFTIAIQIRPHGKPALSTPITKTLSIADHLADLAHLQTLLSTLPTQYPGAQDLYGRNTSIVQMTEPGNPAAMAAFRALGSVAGAGVPYPTEAQKAEFDEAIETIDKLAG
ncbi:hypothetical protein JVU11DRAFT_6050 [Chiua virens]|nr:hypothetical protein JVU11DRAFT_6050 [Chiua virens]